MKSENNSANKFAALVAWVALLAACVLLSACASTVTPKIVQDTVVSFDVNAQNAGFLGFDNAGNGVITEHARFRYNALVNLYGACFTPPVACDAGISPVALADKLNNSVIIGTAPAGAYLIDAQHLVDFAQMQRWLKSNRPPCATR